MTNAIATIGPLQQALALAVEAGDISAMKDVRAMATALQRGAKARKLGIEPENQAAEVVLRAERAIGTAATALREAGAVGLHSGAGAAITAQKRWGVELPIEGDSKPMTWADLGLDYHQVENFTRIASLPEDQFEAMLAEVKELAKRIAKVDFYRAAMTPGGSRSVEERPTSEDPAFNLFRAGAYGLLGWKVDPEGKGRATKNGLLTLPNDELKQLAQLVQALAAAYGEAKNAR